MWLYKTLDYVFPTSFSAKVVSVAIFGASIPVALVAAFLVMDEGLRALSKPVFIVFLVSSGIGMAVLIPGLLALLEPLTKTGRVLRVMQERREFSPLPEDHRDQLGCMMSASNGLALAMGAKLDPRFSKERVDPLTGLLDKAGFEKALLRADSGTLVRVQIDNLTKLRSVHGDVVADGLVAQTGHLMQADVRNGDVVARVGDAEFAIWLKDAGRVVSRHVTQRICDVVKAETAKHPPGVTLSAGAAVREEGETLGQLNARASDAWQEACQLGDRVEIARVTG